MLIFLIYFIINYKGDICYIYDVVFNPNNLPNEFRIEIERRVINYNTQITDTAIANAEAVHGHGHGHEHGQDNPIPKINKNNNNNNNNNNSSSSDLIPPPDLCDYILDFMHSEREESCDAYAVLKVKNNYKGLRTPMIIPLSDITPRSDRSTTTTRASSITDENLLKCDAKYSNMDTPFIKNKVTDVTIDGIVLAGPSLKQGFGGKFGALYRYVVICGSIL
jgi:hypothetical protein